MQIKNKMQTSKIYAFGMMFLMIISTFSSFVSAADTTAETPETATPATSPDLPESSAEMDEKGRPIDQSAEDPVKDYVNTPDAVEPPEDPIENLINSPFENTAKPIVSKKTASRSLQTAAVANPVSQIPANTMVKDSRQKKLNDYMPTGDYATNLFTGSAAYTYPLIVPPGVNELNPALSLDYNHQQAIVGGIVGNGWAITQDYIYRDASGTFNDVSNDKFKLHFNGADQVLLYSASENRYYTEIETYMKIEKKTGATNQKGEYWILKTKDGTIYRFGYNSNSEFVSTQGDFVSMWNLDSITDTHGNSILYSYNENLNSDNYPYPDTISYNNGINTIKFNYASSAINGFNGIAYGTWIKQNYILDNIEVKNNNNLVRKYNLAYLTIDNRKFLNKIILAGSDGSSVLPSVEFSYNQPSKGWNENKGYNLPSEAYLGGIKSNGVKIFDINADGFDDVVRMYNSANMDYWLNNKNSGFDSKKTYSNILEEGFADEFGDKGIRLMDLNGDLKTDIVKLSSFNSVDTKKVLINTANNFIANDSYNFPSGLVFTIKSNGAVCTPDSCPSGTDQGVNCANGICTRVCQVQTCSDSGSVVKTGQVKYPYWSDNDYDEEDTGEYFNPQANKCYKFEYTGSPKTDNDDSDCYDLYTNDGYGEYDEDCQGEDLDAYAGIGFIGETESINSWLSTVPGNSQDSGFIGNVDNSYWRYRYFSRTEEDSTPDVSGSNAGDWDGLESTLCDEAGTHTIYCAPSSSQCSAWGKGNCGYGCAGEETAPFVVLGVYADYDNGLWNALNDNKPACSSDIVEDNDYYGYGTYTVTEYSVNTNYNNQQCSYNLYEQKDTGVRTADINGDGKIDLIKSTDTEKKIWFGQENGFTLTSWGIPSEANFVQDSLLKDGGTRIADINGDSLPDLIKSTDTEKKIWINNGTGFILNANWILPAEALIVSGTAPTGVFFMDINGDRLADILRIDASVRKVWINTGKTWTEDSSWNIPSQVSFIGYSSEIADLDGEGTLDLLYGKSATELGAWTNKFSKAYLLSSIKTAYGGNISLDYSKTTSFDNNQNGISNLPISGWVVSSIKLDNGLNNAQKIIKTINYSYSGGLFDLIDKEFRGFKNVKEKFEDGASVEHIFLQNKSNKGLEQETSVYDASGNIYSKIKSYWNSSNKPINLSGHYIITLDAVENYEYGGVAANPEISKIEFNYDDYGNSIRTVYSGYINAIGDEKTLISEYLYNTASWIVDKVKHTSILDNTGAKIREMWFRYDEGAYDIAPAKGDLTYEEKWNNNGANLVAKSEYDSYGNKIKSIDGLGQITGYEYDASKTFVIKEINPLLQETLYTYDSGTGNILSIVYPGNRVASYAYDLFGRKIKEIMPYDSVAYPTLEITYNLDGVAPESIKTMQRETSGASGTLDSYEYFDGSGNLVQSKIEGDGKYIGLDYYYDNLGRLKIESLPYASISDYTLPNNGIYKSIYAYDPLDRVVNIINPDNTRKTVQYDKTNLIVVDELGNKTEYTQDAYGHIIQVREYNLGQTYFTNYYYDSLGNLIKIINNQNNSINYSFDSFDRKVKVDDPAIGTWTYSYDANGNLLKQTDGKGNIVTFEYDGLNRIKKKTSSDATFNYYYDEGKIGALSKVVSSKTTNLYSYDDRLRLIREEKQIDSKSFFKAYTYDSANRLLSKDVNGENITFNYNNQGVDSIPGFINDIQYNELNSLSIKIYANNMQTVYSYYNDSNRLKEIKTGAIQDRIYDYNAAGDVKQISYPLTGENEKFSYDALSRLLKAEKGNKYNLTYAYDSISNILSINASDHSIIFNYNSNEAYKPYQLTREVKGIICRNNAECNDNDAKTEDVCLDPSTISSSCIHNNITCSANSECGADSYIGGLFCSGKNLTQNYITFTCSNPGTSLSYCTNSTQAKLNQTCTGYCNNSVCISSPIIRRSDLALFNPVDSKWYVADINSTIIISGVKWGSKAMTLVPGDYNADSKTDLAMWNPVDGKWWVIAKEGNIIVNGKAFGTKGMIPVSGDYNADSKTDLAMWNPVDGKWRIIDTNGKIIVNGMQLGTKNMIPVSGDYNGDGKADLAMWNPVDGKWYIKEINGKIIVNGKAFGTKGMIPVSGDYNADSKTDLAMWNPVDGKWRIIDTNGKIIVNGKQWGTFNMIPVSGDYNGA